MVSQNVQLHPQNQGGLKFTSREFQCFTHAMQGKNISQIAEILEIKQRSVYFYLTSIQNKIDILTRQVVKHIP